MQYINTNTDILITEMGVSNEAKNVIPLKFLCKIKNKNVFPLVNSIRGHTVDKKKSKANFGIIFIFSVYCVSFIWKGINKKLILLF
jgi:hypothetical protein